MSYQVIARKWRPQRFEDVVGQSTIAKTLENAILNQRIAHGYLFSGPRGVGKTTTARIFARALNCKQGLTSTPCGTCESCVEIAQGGSMDVLELDAASNRGIDDVRQLREIVKYTPARDRYKIIIIDEAHMLTEPAFNALLKTLEEPPPYVVFILATTESDKMPATILSRCQRFAFRNLAYDLIIDRLQYIANEERIEISPTALEQIAIASEGGMRDAQSLFDQVIAFSGRKVQDQDVASLLGLVDPRVLDQFIQALADKDAQRLLTLISDLINTGCDIQNLCRKLVLHIRHLLITKVAGADPALLPMPSSAHAQLTAQAEFFSEVDLLRFYDVLTKTESELKWAGQPRYHLEVGLLKLIQLRKLMPLEALIGRFNELLKNLSTAEPGRPTAKEPGSKPSPGGAAPSVAPVSASTSFSAARAAAQAEPVNSSPGDGSPTARLLSVIETKYVILHAFLSASSVIDWQGDALTITVPHGSFDVVARKDNVDLIGTLCREITGRPTAVKIQEAAEGNGVPVPRLPDIPTLPRRETAAKRNGPAPPAAPVDMMSRAMSDPVIRDFLSLFTGELPCGKEER